MIAKYRSSKKWLINSLMHQPHIVTPIQRHLYQVASSWLDHYHIILTEIYVLIRENIDPGIFSEIKVSHITLHLTRYQCNTYCLKVWNSCKGIICIGAGKRNLNMQVLQHSVINNSLVEIWKEKWICYNNIPLFTLSLFLFTFFS